MSHTKLANAAGTFLVRGTVAGIVFLAICVRASASGNDAPQPQHSPETSETSTDAVGDLLPAGALARLGTVRLRQAAAAFQTAFTPDSKTLVADAWGGIYFWDVATGKLLRRFSGPEFEQGIVALSPDGKTLAALLSGRFWLLDAATGRRLFEFQGEQERAAIAFSPDGKFLVCKGKKIRIWSSETGVQHAPLAGNKQSTASLAFSPDSRTLASVGGSDPAVRLWDISTGKERSQLVGHKGGVMAVAYSPDGEVLVSIGNGDAQPKVWDLRTGKEALVHSLERLAPAATALLLSFSPDGKIVAARDFRRRIHLWNFGTGKRLTPLEGDAARSPMLLVAGFGFLTFSPDGKLLASTGVGSNSLDLWELASGKKLHSYDGHQELVSDLAFSPDGKFVASAGLREGNGARVWNLQTGKPVRRYGTDDVRTVAYSPDGKTIALGSVGRVLLCDSETGRESGGLGGQPNLPFVNGVENATTGLVFSRDNKTLVSRGSDGRIWIWDIPRRQQRVQIEASAGPGRHLDLSPDGQVVASGNRAKICFWDATSGKELRRFEGPNALISALAFSPDGRTLASGSYSNMVHLWDAATGRELRHFTGHTRRIEFVAYSRDGRTLASGSADETVRLWELATGQERTRFTGHLGGVTSGAFSRDGKRFASGSADTTILVWEVAGFRRNTSTLSRPKLDSLWTDLAAADAARAFQAIRLLAAAPDDAVAFLKERLQPVSELNAQQTKRLNEWIAEISDPSFEVRRRAAQEVENIGELASEALRQAGKATDTLEVRQRLERVLAQVEGWSPRRLRILRAIETLEYIGTTPALRLLEQLGSGSPKALLTQEAKTTLQRVGKVSDQPK